MFNPEVIREVITIAKTHFFLLRVNAMEETKRGRSTHQIPIMSEKLAHVMVLIQRATAAMVKIEADKGNQPEMMSAFELEGVISLPNTGIAKFINVLAKGLEVPKLSGH